MRLRNGGKGEALPSLFHETRRIHIFTYMLRQCICIVFILQFYIVNKRLLNDDKSI